MDCNPAPETEAGVSSGCGCLGHSSDQRRVAETCKHLGKL